MPELPDVEVARRLLEQSLRGTTIHAARCDDRRLLRPRSPGHFARALVGRAVRSVERRGKWLRILFDDGTRLFSHLGMTGEWISGDAEQPPRRSERARLDVGKGERVSRSVRYLDSRRFGRLLIADRDVDEWTELGPDPLADGIDIERFATVLGRRRGAIKAVLMDQTVLAGIGNIIATEALFRARVDPRAQSQKLSRRTVGRLAKALKSEIRHELRARQGGHGYRQDDFAVYGEAGTPCKRCGAVIARTVIGGRTTAFCPGCQISRT
ncbi:MAG TPA: bifunctional DNA-formamidopyrimidine glycosylase/DNA-(apurinic or apyrimidinic site) lyase [Polyangiaceae bacterium]|nr:bifunctional DNA-formamidopyrimidine glycosylase/DNA-(apurinic or apyrimidinic site) lyase [Polyangiaceae bacterium]